MPEKPQTTRRCWPRRLAILAGSFFILLVALYFVITSEAFVKGVVLPRVGQALNADISASRVDVSPFSHLTLIHAQFTPKGAEPLVTAEKVRVRYSLLSILRGNILVYKLSSTAPVVTIIWHADGTCNLDPLVQHSGPETNSSSGSAGPFLDVHSLSLSNATYRQVAWLKQGGSNVLEFTNVTLTAGGTMDFSGTNSIAGKVHIRAESLDLTSLFDFIAETNAPEPGASTPVPGPPTEPDAVQLPFHHFACDLKIAHVRMHALNLTNIQINALLNNSDIAVDPASLSVSLAPPERGEGWGEGTLVEKSRTSSPRPSPPTGEEREKTATSTYAPLKVSGDIDLGVPGYRYDINLTAERLPLSPFMDTFAPDSQGQVGGVVSADVQLKGAGFTGTNLHQNLAGNFDVLSTNLNLSIANVRSPILNTIVDVVISIPDIIREPTALIRGLVRDLEGKKKQKSGWVDDLTSAPIDVIQVIGNTGGGKVVLKQVEIRSAHFRAQAVGEIVFASDLDRSTIQLPVRLDISRALAKQADILPMRTPTNAVYVALPDFLTVKGTFGKPEAAINKLRVAELAVKTGMGVAESLGTAVPEKAGSMIKSADKLVTGKPATPIVTVTNLPPPAAVLQPTNSP